MLPETWFAYATTHPAHLLLAIIIATFIAVPAAQYAWRRLQMWADVRVQRMVEDALDEPVTHWDRFLAAHPEMRA